MQEPLVRIAFETRQEVTAKELTARENLAATIEQAIESFQAEFPSTDVIEIEMYPCPCDCAECAAA